MVEIAASLKAARLDDVMTPAVLLTLAAIVTRLHEKPLATDRTP